MAESFPPTTVQKILAAARAEFGENGFDGTKLETVARKAGITKQRLYYYFKTKDALYEVTLDSLAQDVFGLLDDDRYERLAPAAAIELFVQHMIDAFVERPILAPITLDQALHHGEHISKRSKYIPAIKLFVMQRIVPIIERGQASGAFRQNIDPMIFYWNSFALATAVFLNGHVMSASLEFSLLEPEGIEFWARNAKDASLRLLRA